MIRYAVLAAFAWAGVASADPPLKDPHITQVMSEAVGIHVACIMSEAKKLELSGEPANTIVDGAITACSHSQANLLAVMMLNLMVNYSFTDEKAGADARNLLA